MSERPYPKPSAEDRKKFRLAATMLAELGSKGIRLYLAEDSLNLMKGPSHGERGEALQKNSVEAIRIPYAGGGDW